MNQDQGLIQHPSSLQMQRPPSDLELEATFAPMVVEATNLQVVDAASCEAAARLDQRAQTAMKNAEEFKRPAIQLALAGHRRALEELRLLQLIPGKVREIVGPKVLTWQRAERQRLEAERLRLEAEARKAEEERALNDAIAAERDGDTKLADEILEAPIEAPRIAVAPLPKVQGSYTQVNWDAEVTNLAALVQYVAQHPEDLNLLCANMPALNARAKSQHEKLSIPGVRARKNEKLASRSRP